MSQGVMILNYSNVHNQQCRIKEEKCFTISIQGKEKWPIYTIDKSVSQTSFNVSQVALKSSNDSCRRKITTGTIWYRNCQHILESKGQGWL